MNKTTLTIIITIFILVSSLFYWQKSDSLPDPVIEELTVTPAVKDKTIIVSPNKEADLAVEATTTILTMSETGIVQRNRLETNLLALLNCSETRTCPEDNSDPRASSILLGKMLSENLQQYIQLHVEENYFDQKSLIIVQTFIDYPDGHVQQQAISLMSHQPADIPTAEMLIEALVDGYDAKIMKQSLLELQRYPSLESEIQALLQQTLITGSFYVAQTVANQILPFLNSKNIQSYIELAAKLPKASKRSRYLLANIKEFQLRQTGG